MHNLSVGVLRRHLTAYLFSLDRVAERLAIGILVFCSITFSFSDPQVVVAQDDENDKVELSKLDTFLRNKDGTLIQYFNITFEEFERVYNALNSSKTPDKSDNFSIRTANVIVRVRSRSADIDIELTVASKSDGDFNVPIQLSNAFFPDANAQLVRKDGAFFARLKGRKDQSDTIRLKARQSIKVERDVKKLILDLPSATFTTVQIHELEPGFAFSADQESITRKVAPLFKDGTGFEFAGLKERATISWSKANRKVSGRLGSIDRDAAITAQIEADRIRYKAVFSVEADEPITGLRVGLPKNTAEVELDPTLGMVLNRDQEEDAWKIYDIDLGGQGTRFEDVELKWSVPKSDQNLDLVGFEVFGFQFAGGQLQVKSENDLSFVLADRFNLEKEEQVVSNRQYSYALTTSIFSASVFTILSNDGSQTRADLSLRLAPDQAKLEITLPADYVPENPASINLKLNGWQLAESQSNVTVDELRQLAVVSPVFFLNENQSRKISMSRDLIGFGDKSIALPDLSSLQLGRFRLQIGTSEDVIARLDRTKNRNYEFVTVLDSEIASAQTNVTLNSVRPTPAQLSIRLDPVIPFVEGNRELRLFESRGEFLLESTTVIDSSREFDSVVLRVSALPMNVQLDGQPIEQANISIGQPFQIPLDSLPRQVKLRLRYNLSKWDDEADLEFELSQLFLPAVAGDDRQQEQIETQGRKYNAIGIQSDMEVLTSTGIRISPLQPWQKSLQAENSKGTRYKGGNTTRLVCQKTKVSEEDVHVQRLWCHTSLNQDYRHDRVQIRFVPKRSLVKWIIPDGVKLVGCRLNGKPMSIDRSTGESVIETGFDRLFDEHLIEFNLRYFQSIYDRELNLRLPRTNRVLWCQDTYWSIQLTDSRYVLNYSAGLSANYILDWAGFFMRPTPQLKERELERWIGGDQVDWVDHGGNKYLFSTFGIAEDRSIFVISKTNLVLVFGMVFISFGCAFVSLSFMRNSLFLIAIASGILILGMWYPIWFVQLLQIEIFVAFLFAVGFVVARITAWLSPTQDETRIETNVPSLLLAAPESGVQVSDETRGQQLKSDRNSASKGSS